MNTLAPDGRTWLEHSAEHHDRQINDLRSTINEVGKAPRWKKSCVRWKAALEAHEAMATACREACGK